MKKKVLVIPRSEIEAHFERNVRQDVKIVAPSILTEELFNILKTKGKNLKPEQYFEGHIWEHSEADGPNNLCESGEFVDASLPQYVEGPFSLAFANERAEQDAHYHWRHLEIYYSSCPIKAEYRYLDDKQRHVVDLEEGGALIFGPQVVHRVQLGGLTIIIDVPSVASDKFTEDL